MLLFGYVKTFKPNLRMKEFDAYKAVYCTLCREMGKSYGLLARFTLSYDFAFLSILLMNSSDECPNFSRARCPFNPLVKCGRVNDAGGSVSFSAATAMIMQYFKIKDNIADAPFYKKPIWYLALPLFARARRRAAKKYPEIDSIAENAMRLQRETENEKNPSIDKACEPTAAGLAKTFAAYFENPEQKRIFYQIGYCIGKWIYLIDALDDLRDDIKTKSFNPFIVKYSLEEKSDLTSAAEFAAMQLNTCIHEACAAFELVDSKKFKNILDNIFYEGLPNEQKRVIKGVTGLE